MATCMPVRDMKNTASFTRAVREAGEPVTVTKNGYDELVVMTPKEYERMRQDAAEAHLLMQLLSAERDYAAGNYAEGHEFLSSLRSQYDL